ncbi:MAG: cytochrome P450 [Myxococcales bacterium]|nr:cytochrome P450 [Myxococcales bacterium]
MPLDIPRTDNRVVATIRFGRDPYTYLNELRRRHGDPFRSWLAGQPVVLTGEPELVKQILTADHEAVGSFNPGHLVPLLGAGSMILIDGQRHARERKLLSPPFHGARMRSYARIIREAAARHTAAWPIGQPFVVQHTTQAISLEVIIKAVFGVQDPERVALFERTMLATTDAIWPPSILLKLLQTDLGPLTPWRRFVRAKQRADELVRSEIAARRASAGGGDDILQLMLDARYEDGGAMTDDQIHDELFTLLVAGHETTAIALAWALYWLHRNPVTLARLRAELASVGDDADPEVVARLPYLEGVCHETLRLYPILPLVPRTLFKPMQLGEHTIPAGDNVGFCPAIVHRHPDLYPEPDTFKPERWLVRKFTPFEFIPFGGGIRRCIGAAFALYEMKLVLAAILPHHRLSLLDDRPIRPVRRNLTLGPSGGVRMALIDRT